eukprot:COSAG03_NODE_20310_length_321_cov_0.855856_1_plen_52_part_10
MVEDRPTTFSRTCSGDKFSYNFLGREFYRTLKSYCDSDRDGDASSPSARVEA